MLGKRINKRVYPHLLPLAYIGLFLVILSLLTYREWRQQEQNRALLAQIEDCRFPEALLTLRAGADPNSRETLTSQRWPVWRLLWEGLQRNHTDTANGTPALTAAIECAFVGYGRPIDSDSRQLIAALIEQGADVNATTGDGTTALMVAVNDGHSEVVTLLLKHGADVHTRNKAGVTALLLAEEKFNSEFEETLRRAASAHSRLSMPNVAR